MTDRFVTVRLERRLVEALDYYVPRALEGRTRASARVRFTVVAWLHEHDSCHDTPRIARSNSNRRGPAPTTARRRRR